jgi:hypothetical protein
MNSDSVSEARGRMALSRDQIERELKAIEKIDQMFLGKKVHSSKDAVGYEARRVRKRELVKLIDDLRD